MRRDELVKGGLYIYTGKDGTFEEGSIIRCESVQTALCSVVEGHCKYKNFHDGGQYKPGAFINYYNAERFNINDRGG